MTIEESTAIQQKFILSLNPIQVEVLRLKLKAVYDSWEAWANTVENERNGAWAAYQETCRVAVDLDEYFKSILSEEEFKSPKIIFGVIGEWRSLYEKFLFIS